MSNYIAINLNYLLRQTDLSQDDFGKMFDLKRGSLGRYLRKLNEPKIGTLQKICSHFNLTIDDFINGDIRQVYNAGAIAPQSVGELPATYNLKALVEKFSAVHVEELVRYIISREAQLMQSETFKLWIENKVHVKIYREDFRNFLKK
jgi:transcriptional regulator with XRE-family HTH domain